MSWKIYMNINVHYLYTLFSMCCRSYYQREDSKHFQASLEVIQVKNIDHWNMSSVSSLFSLCVNKLAVNQYTVDMIPVHLRSSYHEKYSALMDVQMFFMQQFNFLKSFPLLPKTANLTYLKDQYGTRRLYTLDGKTFVFSFCDDKCFSLSVNSESYLSTEEISSLFTKHFAGTIQISNPCNSFILMFHDNRNDSTTVVHAWDVTDIRSYIQTFQLFLLSAFSMTELHNQLGPFSTYSGSKEDMTFFYLSIVQDSVSLL